MSQDGLEALRTRVHEDFALARRLYDIEPARFSDEVTRVAAELGCDVTANDVREAVAQWVRDWMLRWIR
jgi:hypothetical protein